MRATKLPYSSLVKKMKKNGLGITAVLYISIDYLRHVSPSWHQRLQSLLWIMLASAAILRIPFYNHWSLEFSSVIPFISSMIFMLSTLFIESIATRFVTVVVGLKWHSETAALPDTGQWILLALNEKLPSLVVNVLRNGILGLRQYLMLFVILAFSVLFNSVRAPGLGLGARYMFTMALGRILRTITFVSTILPSSRPWCARFRFRVPTHPHPWAQKYHMPYSRDVRAIRFLLDRDKILAGDHSYRDEYRPDWGLMSFLANFLRPTDHKSSWYSWLSTARGGCNDLVYSGHMFVAVSTAMAWTEAYGGWTSSFLWLLVMHSAQREIRRRHHYTVDCVMAIFVGIVLWNCTSFIWSSKDTSSHRRFSELEKLQGRLMQAAKDSDMEKVRNLLTEVDLCSQSNEGSSHRATLMFGCITIIVSLTIVILTLTWTSDG